MRRGLVVGRFMPLHRGHQLLIEEAFASVDDLTIVVYDSEPDGAGPAMPVAKRLGWLRSLYPQAESILALPDPVPLPEADDPANAAAYAEQLAFLGRFERFFSSEPAYERFAELIGAKHVVIDEARELVPISATEIRGDLHGHRGFLDPLVYASLVQKVVFVGTESTGKTTLAKRMAEEYAESAFVHEYGRELWEAQGLTGTFADHLRIALTQRRREEAAARHARDFVFCDTNAWTTLHWSVRSYGTVDARLAELVDTTIGDYVWFLCANDFGWVQDGIRELLGDESSRFQEQQVRDLGARGVAYTMLTGPVEERVDTVRRVLETLP